jgi:hypothetical protein
MLGIEIDVGRRQVIGRPRVGDKGLYTHLLEVIIEMVNLRSGGPLGESGGSLVGKDGECDMESRGL